MLRNRMSVQFFHMGWHFAGEKVIRYPSVNWIGFWRLTAGSILFSRSLLNSKASSTRNGFNNISF